ncbi:MAG: glutamine-hydrolyzing GMP synthase [Firmicutes bacterium]|nr:glutamine-hydrolyzing GMP synthase [Bacillota bacterium]MCL2255543.1 glutamine-hydrolyzing GMP synthase [Bacillota bacterium]
METILVLDFGGQYKELICRAVRNLNVYAIIESGNISLGRVKEINPVGIILTGGPQSVYSENAPKCDERLFDLGVPMLGICYGMQLMTHMLGGEVSSGEVGEYGQVNVTCDFSESDLLNNIKLEFVALMSHRDVVSVPPPNFQVTAKSPNAIAVIENKNRKLYGVQFHPETRHTKFGKEIISNFLDVCGVVRKYRLKDYVSEKVESIRKHVGVKGVLLGLSGGVDSSVCAALLSKAIHGQLTCVFVDHGFMRKDEGDEIEKIFSKFDLNFIRVNAQERFLKAIEGVSDPERKRKIIGNEFVRVFEDESKKLGNIPYLAQGTIYPDIVESGGEFGSTIKSHHNVGGLPEKHNFDGLVEPLSGLFKDEVRKVGIKLGLPPNLVNRQPFPGPGLAIRVMGEVTHDKLEKLKQVDAIFRHELESLSKKPSQYFAVLTQTLSVGVKGDERTYDYVVALRAVSTDDFMTCEYSDLPNKLLRKISSKITSEVQGVSRVVYDISSKPPSTIEWE